MPARECQKCKELVEAAQSASIRHIEAQSKLRMANMRFDHQAATALKQTVEETSRERERAVAELHEHLQTHGGEIGRTANG
jgi:hypothetical protein